MSVPNGTVDSHPPFQQQIVCGRTGIDISEKYHARGNDGLRGRGSDTEVNLLRRIGKEST